MDKRLTIKKLASLIGVTADTIINWELRNVKPRKKALKKLKGILEV